MIDSFAMTNLPQPPLYVTEEFMKLTAEAKNRIYFRFFKAKYSIGSENILFWPFMNVVFLYHFKFCRSTVDFICNDLAL